jgi:hypothetical protein
MARFNLLAAHVFGGVKVRGGKNIVDTLANAQPGDVIVGTLTSASVTPSMNPLDAAASTLKNNSPYASVAVPGGPSGRDSID